MPNALNISEYTILSGQWKLSQNSASSLVKTVIKSVEYFSIYMHLPAKNKKLFYNKKISDLSNGFFKKFLSYKSDNYKKKKNQLNQSSLSCMLQLIFIYIHNSHAHKIYILSLLDFQSN